MVPVQSQGNNLVAPDHVSITGAVSTSRPLPPAALSMLSECVQ